MRVLYKLDVNVKDYKTLSSTNMSIEELCHLRYGHPNFEDLALLQKKEMVEGLPVFKNEHAECDGCAIGKQHRKVFPIIIDKRKLIDS